MKPFYIYPYFSPISPLPRDQVFHTCTSLHKSKRTYMQMFISHNASAQSLQMRPIWAGFKAQKPVSARRSTTHTHTHLFSHSCVSCRQLGGGSFSCLFSLDLFCTSFPHQSGFARARRIGTATREKTYMYMYIPVDLVNMNNSHAYQNLCLRSHDSTRGERKERAHTHTHTYLYL